MQFVYGENESGSAVWPQGNPPDGTPLEMTNHFPVGLLVVLYLLAVGAIVVLYLLAVGAIVVLYLLAVGAIVVLYLLAVGAIVFAVVCMVFNFIFRKNK